MHKKSKGESQRERMRTFIFHALTHRKIGVQILCRCVYAAMQIFDGLRLSILLNLQENLSMSWF